MPTQEVTRDAPPRPQLPLDESVVLPAAVRAAKERSEAYYQQPPVSSQPDPAAPAISPQPDSAPVPQPDPAPPVAAAPAPAPAPTPAPSLEFDPYQARDTVPPEEWEHRFNSMRGRWKQRGDEITGMQDQMVQMGDELIRTQQLVRQIQQQPPAPAAPPAPPVTAITDTDRENYSADLIDFVQRAAADAARKTLEPEITSLKQGQTQLVRTATQSAKTAMITQLDQQVPNWEEINKNPRFKAWLRLRDIYSGRVRAELAEEARRAADATRLVSFFQGFLKDEATTGHVPSPDSQPAPAPAPRQPGVRLETLAAPGRPRPASGETPSSASKPTFTRADIQNFYSDVRRGVYAGQEVEKVRRERELFAAQNEGRIRG